MGETAVVSIGRNVSRDGAAIAALDGSPMGAAAWLAFVAEVRGTVAVHGLVVFEGFGHGVYDGVPEDSWTAIVADVHDRIRLRKLLGGFARRWGQDSIALTVGATVFCGQEGTEA